MDKHITVPMKKETVATLKAGDYVYLTGTVYTARDAAHKRMYEILQEGGELPIDIQGQVIYYMGPSPAREGRPIGSAGPTTASRMDKYAPQLLDLGLGAMIGKGKRNQAVIDAIVQYFLRLLVERGRFFQNVSHLQKWSGMTILEQKRSEN